MTQKYSFWIYGSGRWAKILAQQLQMLYGSNALLNFITNRDQHEFKRELLQHKIQNFDIFEDLGPISGNRLHFGIVCGRARYNYNRVMKLLGSGLSVYVEKPCALNFKEANEMVKYADIRRLCLYFSNAFLFNDQINALILDAPNQNDITKIKINWIDEKSFDLAKNNLKYDVSLTVYEDVLPHVLNIVSSILNTVDIEFIDINVRRFGQKVKIKCFVSNVETELILERNGSRKTRSLEIHTLDEVKTFDFSHRRFGSKLKLLEGIRKDDDLGPLSMSLYDFVCSVEKQKSSEFNNKVIAQRIIELFPEIEEKYLIKCLENLKDKNLGNNFHEENLSYLTTEIMERRKLFEYDLKNEYLDRSLVENMYRLYCQLESQLKKSELRYNV